jgi:hypothetical protein
MFTGAEDKPFPGGLENGVGKRLPQTPCTKCGTKFDRNAPAKKHAT